jgi:ABC-2 type transport system permease protein
MVYLKFISMSFQRSLAYRVEYFTAILNAFLYIFIFVSVWNALIPEEGLNSGITRQSMTAYAVLSTLIKASFGRNDSLLSQKVKSGEIATDLMKPYYFPLMYLADTIGSTLFQLFSRVIPLLIFCVFLFGIRLPVDGELLLRFLPVYLLSFSLFFLLSFFISSLSFYFVEIFPFYIFYYALITLTSGAVIPLDFFPAGIGRILEWTPFPYLFYYPTMLLLQKSGLPAYSELLVRYGILIAVLLLPGTLLYQMGLRKLTIAGG